MSSSINSLPPKKFRTGFGAGVSSSVVPQLEINTAPSVTRNIILTKFLPLLVSLSN
jgi:hypothetical protein